MVRAIPTQDTWYDRVVGEFRAFALDKSTLDHVKIHQDIIKRSLMAALEENGEPDEKGHYWIHFDAPIDGFEAIQRQRKVSVGSDEQEIEEILAAKGVRDRCFKMVEVLDEDEVMALRYEGVLTDEDLDRMFPKTITWAFVPKKA